MYIQSKETNEVSNISTHQYNKAEDGDYRVVWSTETDRSKFIQAFSLKRRQRRPFSSREISSTYNYIIFQMERNEFEEYRANAKQFYSFTMASGSCRIPARKYHSMMFLTS